MSKLQELIQQYCPDGVEYFTLEKIAYYSKKRIDISEINADNYISVENLLQNKQGKISANTLPKDNSVIGFCVGDILIGNIRPYLRKIWLADCNGGTNGDVLAIHIIDKQQIKPEFLYYVLSSENFFLYDIQNSKGAKMPRGDKTAVMQYIVPVPPLEVQAEIVRILDTFTEVTKELQTKLEEELTARQKQYEYYRDSLLNFEGMNDVNWVETKDLCIDRFWLMPATPSYIAEDGIKYITSKNIKNNKIDFSTATNITRESYDIISQNRKVMKGDFLITMIGTIGEVALVENDKPFYGQNLYLLRLDETKIHKLYYKYCFENFRYSLYHKKIMEIKVILKQAVSKNF